MCGYCVAGDVVRVDVGFVADGGNGKAPKGKTTMRAKVCSILFSVLIAVPAWSQVKGPSDLTIAIGRLEPLPLTIDADELEYSILGDDVRAFREYVTDPKIFRLQIIGYAPGKAWLVVSSVKGGKLQPQYKVAITITGKAPDPTPVDPPAPTDPDAAEISRLAAALRSGGVGFKKWQELSEGLDDCRVVAGTAKNTGGFVPIAREALKNAMSDEPLPDDIKKILADETTKILPTDADKEWTPATQRAAKAMYSKLSKAVKAAGGIK